MDEKKIDFVETNFVHSNNIACTFNSIKKKLRGKLMEKVLNICNVPQKKLEKDPY
jgi:hypothetical protein